MKISFLAALNDGVLLCDGAMGTEIYSRGIPLSRCYSELNLSQPELVRAIHESYLQAGAQLIETNTFGANAITLARYGLEKKVREINLSGARIAREASQRSAYIAGSVGPAAQERASGDGLNEAQLYDAFSTQIEALRDGGADLIILETFSDLQEAEVAYRAARSATDLPVVVQLSFHSLSAGHFRPTPEEAIRTGEQWGADVMGANCGDGPQGVLECMERMAKVSSKKLSAMPSAGLPSIKKGSAFYPILPGDMAVLARRLVQVRVSLIGGCCGTTPAMIRAMKRSLKPLNP